MVAGVVERAGLRGVLAAGVRRQGRDAAFSAHDRIHLGSCTKAFTATLAALLVADGRISWQATVVTVLAAEPVISRGWRDVTLEDLLRHCGGAPEEAPPAAWRAAWSCARPPHECRAAFVGRLLADDPPEKRGEYHYSNQGYAIAARMLETVADRPYEALLAERLLVPLGITSAGFGPPSATQPDAPVGHDDTGAPDDIDNPAAIAPAGTLHMTVADWARFLAVHLGGPLPEALAALGPVLPDLQRPFPTAPGEVLGWVTARRPWGGRVLNHAGSNTRWYCVAWLAPERGFGVVAAANQGGAAAAKGCDEACAALIVARRG
jgi:CubicO group peptidase (beta-lactamase class C family)